MYDLIESTNFYLFALPAVVLFGLSKRGLSGLGALATPVLALAISPVKAAAILLPILVPILIVQDWISVCCCLSRNGVEPRLA